MKVLIAVSDSVTKKMVRELLVQRGHAVAGEATNASDALRKGRHMLADLVVMDTELEGGRVGQVAMILEEDGVAPVLLLAHHSDPEVRDFAYVLKPICTDNLIPALESTWSSYRRRSELILEVDRLRDQLETRRLVDQAKSLLAAEGLSEEEAHRHLQKTSMSQGMPLKSVAKKIIIENQEKLKGARKI